MDKIIPEFRWLRVKKPRNGALPEETIQIGTTPAGASIYAVLQTLDFENNKMWISIPIVEED